MGPRPSLLMVSKNSTKIKKPKHSSPVVIYLKSPQIIHVRPEEFMQLVQRLTGKQENQNLAKCNVSSTLSLVQQELMLPGLGAD